MTCDTPRPSIVPCETCERATAMTGTRRCDSCWEVEHRLDGYIRDGGRRAILFVIKTLNDAAAPYNIRIPVTNTLRKLAKPLRKVSRT